MRLTRYLLCVPAWLLVADAAIATQTLGAPVGTSALPIAGLSLLGVAVAGLAIGIRIVRRKRKEK